MPKPRSPGGGRRHRKRSVDSELFEQALERMNGLSASELAELKADSAPPPTEEIRRSARFDKRAERGEIDPEATLDLHGCDRVQASRQLRSFLDRQRRTAATVVLVIHGKGERILAQSVSAELDRHALVAEHVAAPRRFGGAGARLVRLRRS